MHQFEISDFDQWRSIARDMRQRNVPPSSVQFMAPGQSGLFASVADAVPESDASANNGRPASFRVPKEFLAIAQEVAYHRDGNRWNLLYRVLWRLTTDEPQLMLVFTDDDIHRLMTMEKSVRRDAHKMKAFVRFRKVQTDGKLHYVAWHRPDHYVVRKVAPFFSRRFKAMDWTILTPDESVAWNQSELQYFEGLDRSHAPSADELEDLWRTYYANIFNPARVKIKAMKAEMPVRHWATLPEASMIDQMLKDAPRRVQEMVARSEGYASSARQFFPEQSQPLTLPRLAQAIRQCRACDLHCNATQAVFGRGPEDAQVVIVGEQPGDREDMQGEPFVGPAGEVLDRALKMAGVDRASVYVTNTVKHFKFQWIGKRRLHQKPDARQVRACLPWFEAEWECLAAKTLVCLGTTAAQALISPGFRMQQQRGQLISSRFCDRSIATWHPASIIRLPDPALREIRLAELASDLRLACQTR